MWATMFIGVEISLWARLRLWDIAGVRLTHQTVYSKIYGDAFEIDTAMVAHVVVTIEPHGQLGCSY